MEVISRAEAYLNYALKNQETYPKPISRIDYYLLSLAQEVRSGGADPATITEAVNTYLAENPVSAMTDEQIATSVNKSISDGTIEVISELESTVGSLKEDLIDKASIKKDINKEDMWEVGTIDSNGNNISLNTRLRTKNTILADNIKSISVKDGYEYAICCYNSENKALDGNKLYLDIVNKQMVTVGSVYIKSTVNISDIKDIIGEYKYIRLLLRNVVSTTEITLSEFSNISIIKNGLSNNAEDILLKNGVSVENSINAINKVNTVDLVLFMGQSNMSGQGEDATKATVLEDGEGYEFRAVSDATKLYKAVEPFGSTENNSAISDTKTGGMVTSIMKGYYKNRGIPIVGVSASYCGSGIDQWQPNTTFYNEAVRRANLAKTWLTDNNYTIKDIFLVWCQGEHEANLGKDFSYYKTNLFNIFNGLKNDVGVQKCFIVRIGNKQNDNDAFTGIIEAQTNIAKYYKDYILATTKLSEMNDRKLMRTTYHYVQSAYNEIGLDAGANIASYFKTGKEPYMYDYKNDNLYYSFETNRGYIINVKGISLDKNTLNIGIDNKTYGDNLFNSSNYDSSHYTEGTNIVLNTSYPYVVSSDYIEVEGGETYELSHNNITNMGIWFDENKNAISSFTGKTSETDNIPVTIKAPDNAKYIKFNINTNKIQLKNVCLKKVTITGTSTLVATIIPEDATNKNVTFTSSDKTKVTIDNNGVVTGVAEGTATITVTTEDGNFTDTCTVTVTA